MRDDLPPVWRRFLERSVPSSTWPASPPIGAMLTQRGELCLEDGRWRRFTAEQTFETEQPGFLWHARVAMAPLVTAVVEDAYEDGHGRLEAKVFGLFRVAKGEAGIDLDRGELIRYLAELAWNPLALVHNAALRFSTSPEGLPRVSIGDDATYVDCAFDAAGDLVEVHTTTRPRGTTGPCPWSGRFLRYAQVGPARIPVEAEVAWVPASGRAPYWRGTIETFAWR